jgi:pimeloyl-ACP methyl ester carboxylesterase
MPNTMHFAVRKTKNKNAILFIHGFSGETHHTFGMLPAFLAGHPKLTAWDIHCFGYPTSLAPDISGVWSADPDITTLGGLFSTACTTHFKEYEKLALIAHSMGGLVVQQALVAHGLEQRCSHVALFGTPSKGLRKSRLAKLFKRQTRDMADDSDFIKTLRKGWNDRYIQGTPFLFKTVAGAKDEFVPEDSSLGAFGSEVQAHVNGNHLEIVKPETVDSDTTVLLIDLLGLQPGAPAVAAANTVSSRDTRTVSDFWEIRNTIGSKELVKLALALEMVGRQKDAIDLLTAKHAGDTELTGVLAGRHKRRWLADSSALAGEGDRALSLYVEAYHLAAARGDRSQAFYHGINVAFLNLALLNDRGSAQQIALEVLEHCKQADPEKWRFATEGEAYLYLDNLEASLHSYGAALRSDPSTREVDSITRQAIWAARLLDNPVAEARLVALFQVLPGDEYGARWSG